MKLATRQYKCGVCQENGHNARRCPQRVQTSPKKVMEQKMDGMTREERVVAIFDLLEDKSTTEDW